MARPTRWLLSFVAFLMISSSGVQAQEWKAGRYAEIGGGFSLLSDNDATQFGAPLSMSTK